MALVILIQVDSSTTEFLKSSRCIPSGIEFRSTTDSEAWMELMSGDGLSQVDAAVVGTFVPDPVSIAQRIHAKSRDVSVVLLADGHNIEQLIQAVQFSPLIGVGTVCVSIESLEAVEKAIRNAALASRRKRSHKVAMAAVDSQLSRALPPLRRNTYVEHLLHHAPIGVVVTESGGRVLAWNSFAAEITGVSERTALGRPLFDLLTEPWRSEFNRLIKVCSNRQQPANSPVVIDDGNRAIEVVPSVLQGMDETCRVILLMRDITELVRARNQAEEALQRIRGINEELEKTRDAAVDASRAKSAFLANMSHELRTPLNAVIGYSEMLQEQIEEENRHDLSDDLKRIESAGRHLLALINDILDLSKIEAGKMELYVSRFQVRPMIEEVADTLRPAMAKNRNTLTILFVKDPGVIQADEVKVRQILYNLLSNAAKFTENGEITLLIDEESTGEGNFVVFRVSDTGIGMTDQQVATLFRDFSQVDSSTTRRHGGTGLGLAISKRFCTMMRGEINVVSRHGNGSTFTAKIPVFVPGNRHSATEERHGGEQVVLPVSLSPNTVLVIDDDSSVHNLLSRFLHKEKFQMIAAFDGKRGLELARERIPRAIILDVMMPEMDGWSVLAQLKADSRTAEIPVIIISMVEEKNLGFALGATDYLTKPVERERLLSVLRKYECDVTNCTVLIVEDDPTTRELLRRLLSGVGCNTMLVENGRAGLEVLHSRRVDMVILDLMMPEMDGFEFLERMRNVAQWRSIPVLVVTAKELDENDHRKLNGAVDRVLQKSQYTREELLHDVCHLLSRV